jgi:hypothetical protein
MGIVRVLADVEDWLEADAESWSALADQEYVALARRWRDMFMPLIVGSAASFPGDRAGTPGASRMCG